MKKTFKIITAFTAISMLLSFTNSPLPKDPITGEEKNKEVVKKFIEEFKNKGNHDIVDGLFSNDFVHHFNIPNLPKGKEGAKMVGKSVVGGFPDVKVTIEDIFAEGDKVVERSVAVATHKGTFNGVPATGKSVSWSEIHIYKLKDGKITEWWSQADMLAILMQIGALPAPK